MEANLSPDSASRSSNAAPDVVPSHLLHPIIGHGQALQEVLRQAEMVAQTDATVLIVGESGTGKELIAQLVHDASAHRSGPLVKVNTAAIPTGLLESELFGHEKGAFTGAIGRRVGRFESAHDGSIFLDEIGEMSLDVQPKLLRVLQEREFERLGGRQTLRSNARVIAATHRDLSALVQERTFREDLYYRLNVFPIRVPPLRERRDDIPALAQYFAQRFARKMGKPTPPLSSATLSRLALYHWPGNVRELQNVIERAVILATGNELTVQLPGCRENDTTVSHAAAAHAYSSLDEVQRTHILAVLNSTGWVVAGPRGAAAKLGMKRSTLIFRLKKLGITQQTKREQWLPHSA